MKKHSQKNSIESLSKSLEQSRDNNFLFFIKSEQFCEELLKVIICDYSHRVRKLLKSKFFFKPTTYQEIKERPLEKLIKEFKKFCDDDELLKDLEELRKLRNNVVHQEFCETKREGNNIFWIHHKSESLNYTYHLSSKIFYRLVAFSKKIVFGYLLDFKCRIKLDQDILFNSYSNFGVFYYYVPLR